MKGFIDRIEDSRVAVIILEEGGEMLLPSDAFPFKIREGMHLKIEMSPDPESEKNAIERVRGLQQELLQRTEDRRKEDKEK